jgi:hypothetical protein
MTDTTSITNINAFFVGKKCVIRTYSAGVWFGEIAIKDHDEVIVLNARRLWGWKAAESISLSAVALYGLVHAESRVPAAVPHLWLQAIELIPASHTGIESIESCPEPAAQ